MRTLVDIPDEDIERLDALAVKANRSRAAEIREAVRAHLDDRSNNDWVRRGSGYWQGRTDIGQPD
jgi:predicted DNA-binding protein